MLVTANLFTIPGFLFMAKLLRLDRLAYDINKIITILFSRPQKQEAHPVLR